MKEQGTLPASQGTLPAESGEPGTLPEAVPGVRKRPRKRPLDNQIP